MTAKTRYFMFGSVLVLVVGLSIGLVAYYGGMPAGLFKGDSGPAELKYIPGDAAVVAYANVRAVMNSEMRQRLQKLEGVSDEGRAEFKNETGIDIENDIDSIVACMSPKGEGAAEQTNGLVVARGRFDVGRLEALALQHGAKVGDYKGKRLMTMAPKPDHGETGQGREMAIAFLGSNLVAMGGADIVRLAIDRGEGAAGFLANAEMMKLVNEMDTASLWAVGRFDAIRAEAKLPVEVSERIPSITWFAASGNVNGGVQAMVKAETKDEEAANNLRDIIRGFVALAKMQAGSSPAVKAMMPDIQLGGDGKVVSVSFNVTTEMLDAITAAKDAAAAVKKIEKSAPKAEQK